MRGCVTGGRLAGARGRAGCGVLPGSSIRSRIVGGTKRPVGGSGAVGAAAATGTGGSSSGGSSTTGGSSTATEVSGTVTTGGASSTSTGGGGSTSTVGGGGGGGVATVATGTRTSTGSGSTAGAGGGGGVGATPTGAVASVAGCGLTVLTRRGGPRTGAVGFGGSTFLGAGAFLAVLAGTACSANMSPPGSEMLRCRARRSTNERATTSSIVLEALFSSIP
jgi:hypothetical protein